MRFRYALIFVLGASLQASAADLSEPPGSLKDTPVWLPPLWQGFYVGGHVGGVWGDTGVNDNFTYAGDPSFNGSMGSAGFIGGAQAGYNFQRDHFVFGVEGDIGYLGLSASKSASLQPPNNQCSATYSATETQPYNGAICDVNAKYSVSSDLYGDLTGRFGYTMDRILFYAKGGAALLNADFKANYEGANCLSIGKSQPYSCPPYTGSPSTFNYDHGDTLVGWTIGAGVEYALNASWSLKVEYQHFDFGSMSYSYSGCYAIPGYGTTCPAANAQYNNHYTSVINGKTDVSLTADAVTIGVNYHLGGVDPLK